jgi:NADPH2:quinone reductase
MMTKAIRIHSPGGPEVMKWEDVPTPDPGPGEALIKQEAVGLNYIDVYFRTGQYKAPSMPLVIGQEGAGTVVSVGPNVTLVQPGDRVAYAGAIGGYAGSRVIAADRLVKLPDGIDFQTAAAMMLQGMTAQYLLRRTYEVKPGDTIVAHAAAGGVSRRHGDRRGVHPGEGGNSEGARRGAHGGWLRRPGGGSEAHHGWGHGAGGV